MMSRCLNKFFLLSDQHINNEVRKNCGYILYKIE